MSKILRIVILLLVVGGSSIVTGKLFYDRAGVPDFFQLPDKQNARLCCAECEEDYSKCSFVTENMQDVCFGYINPQSIGLIDFPDGRKITTSQRLNNLWSLLWIENGTEPVLRSRLFDYPHCAWRSDVSVDDELDRDATEALVEKIFVLKYHYHVLASLEHASCHGFKCDVTVYRRGTRINNDTNEMEEEILPRDEL